MTELMIAVTNPMAAERVLWLDAEGASQSATWDEFAAQASGRPWALLIDGSQVTLFEITLPVRDLSTARRAAPFAIEDQLAQTLDDTAIALAPRGGNAFAIAACARTVTEDLGRRLDAAGLHPELVVPEPCALPWQDSTWTIALRDQAAVLRTGSSTGLKVPLDGLGETVALLRQQLPDTRGVTVYGAPADHRFPHAAFDGLALQWRPPIASGDMAAALAATPAPLLLDMSHRAGIGERARRLWIGAAAAALVVVALYTALFAFGNGALARTEHALKAANRAAFEGAFPTVTRVVDPRLQAQQALSALRAGAVTTPQFLELLAAFDRAIAAELSLSIRVRSVAFAGGLLEISVETADMGELERLRALLGTAGLGAEMLSAESTADAVIARLRLKEPG